MKMAAWEEPYMSSKIGSANTNKVTTAKQPVCESNM